MPRIKPPKIREPIWKEWDRKAQKNGLRHTIFSVNGDQYTGEWVDNNKTGKGTYIWKENGAIYEGDWKNGKRTGVGTISFPDGKGGYNKSYAGGWKNHQRHGFSTQYYEDEHYEGEWCNDKRSGWGRMFYKDGSLYDGEWKNDQRSGYGMFREKGENRYEGLWKHDKRNGAGKFYHLDSGQVFEGVWVNNIPKCGVMKDFGRDESPQATKYPIPELELQNPHFVVAVAEQHFTETIN